MLTINQMEKFFRDSDISYEKKGDILLLGGHSEQYNYRMIFSLNFKDVSKSVDVVCYASFNFNYVSQAVLSMVNDFNKQYRYFKFYVDDDNTLLMHATAIVRENESVAEVMELVSIGRDILDECYPTIQKVMWR